MSLQALLKEIAFKGNSTLEAEVKSHFEDNASSGFVSFDEPDYQSDGVIVPFHLLDFSRQQTSFTGRVKASGGAYTLQLDHHTLPEISGKTPYDVELAFNPKSKVEASKRAVDALIAAHGEEHRDSIEAGVSRVADRWQGADGTISDFEAFCVEHFISDPEQRSELLSMLEFAVEHLNGHHSEVLRSLKRFDDLYGYDFHLANKIVSPFDPSPDLVEQLFRQKVAHLALLNFNQPRIDLMLESGQTWSEDEWRSVRVMGVFTDRVPANVSVLVNNAETGAMNHVMNFHVNVGTLVDEMGVRVFDKDQTLQPHWYVREEIKAGYGDPENVYKQRALARILARTNDGTLPKVLLSGTIADDWDPIGNTIGKNDPGELIGLARYEAWINNFKAMQEVDKFCPNQPTAIDRKYEIQREMSERQVVDLLCSLLSSPILREIARFTTDRIGRNLEPFDIYYTQAGSPKSVDKLDQVVRDRYKSMEDFQKKIPEILMTLGFSSDEAQFIGDHLIVERCKGAGHASPAGLLGSKPWIRLSSSDGSFGWQQFNTAMHELGHGIEMVYSMYNIPHSSLRGVPNAACTEAFAFLYQARAEIALGLADESAVNTQFAIDSVEKIMETVGIAGTSLVEHFSWRWLYENPQANPEQLRDQVLAISKDIWDSYYKPIFGEDPYNILASYQHIIAFPLYVPDYALGFIMAHQIGSYMRGRDLAEETKRITSIGRVTPELWMQRATGSGISIEPLVRDAEEGLSILRSKN